MSLINDALKRARHTPPRDPQSPFPLLPPVAERPASAAMWLIPAIVIFLLATAIFFIGWAMAHRPVQTIVMTPPASVATAPSAVEPAAAIAPPVVAPPPEEVEVPLNPPNAPKVQGIFYSPTTPAAIVDGKMLRPGDRFHDYRVTEITRYTVTLIGADGKVTKLGMGD